MAYDIEIPFDRVNIPFLYHYRGADKIDSIFLEDGVRLKMRRGDMFPDKMEGKSIEVYYDIALEELLHDQKILQEQFDYLAEIKASEEDLFIVKEPGGYKIAKSLPADAYVVCFSSVKNDPFMFEHYGSKDQNKYCLEFYTSLMETLSHKDNGAGTRTELFQIMYGKQVVAFLKKKILQITKSGNVYENATLLLPDLLRRTQYAAKLAKYSKDNEIRLVVSIPKDVPFHNDYYERDGDEWLWLHLPKQFVSGCWPRAINDSDVVRQVEQLWRTRGYDYLCEER